MLAKGLILSVVIGVAAPVMAVDCTNKTFESNSYTLCSVDLTQENLRLFLRNTQGETYGEFSAIEAALAGEGHRLAFAMNAGMYHRDRAPVGHYVEGGFEVMRVVPNAGPGNFGLLPNGIFCIGAGRAEVIETLAFVADPPECAYATQSGPMLVIEGALHPRFLPESTSRYIRNGVGTNAAGSRADFVISNTPVTFYSFGRFFRDVLNTPNALYFDGNVSRLYAPEIGRSDLGRQMGPIVGVVE